MTNPTTQKLVEALAAEWGTVSTKHRTDNGAPYQVVEFSMERLGHALATTPPLAGQEPVTADPQTCQCKACLASPLHWSDCAVHSEPAYPAGPCDCGGFFLAAMAKPVLTDEQIHKIFFRFNLEGKGMEVLRFARALIAAAQPAPQQAGRLDSILTEINYGKHHGWPRETLDRLERMAAVQQAVSLKGSEG